MSRDSEHTCGESSDVHLHSDVGNGHIEPVRDPEDCVECTTGSIETNNVIGTL